MKNCLFMFSVSALSVIEFLIQCGANVNRIHLNSRTGLRPLHAIARCDDTDIAKPIIELLLAHDMLILIVLIQKVNFHKITHENLP